MSLARVDLSVGRQRGAASIFVFNDENGMNTLGEKSGR